MKKTVFVLLILPCIINAQSINESKPKEPAKTTKVYPAGKNIFNMNLSSLAFNNFSFTYERLIANKVSLSLNYRFMSKSGLPYQDKIKSLFNNPGINFNHFQLGNYAITPELRLYAHKNMRGFYIAPYARYASFDLTIPVKYNPTQSGAPPEEANFSGTITSFSGGLLLGTQHNLGKHIIIDIWIIGAHFGSSSGTLNTDNINPPLTTQQQKDALQSAIDGINASPFKVTGKVTSATTAYLDASGPWLGVRGLGINLGIRF